MSRSTGSDEQSSSQIHHPVFAAVYDWLAGRDHIRRMIDPLRRETAGQARGLILEVDAGSGLNFPLYTPGHVERVEAIEPDAAMLAVAWQLPCAHYSHIGPSRSCTVFRLRAGTLRVMLIISFCFSSLAECMFSPKLETVTQK